MINLFFSDAAAGSAAYHRKKLGIENDTILPLGLYLYVGDISEPFSVCNRKDVYNAYFELECNDVSNEIERLNHALQTDCQLCLWFTKSDISEYLGMLATIYQYYGKGITFFQCDCSDICKSIADLQNHADFGKVQMRKVSDAEIEDVLIEWQEIQSENAALRMMKDGKVVNLPADYIDERIFSIMGDRDTKVAKICDYVTRQEDMQRKLTFILFRIRQLIADGKISIVSEAFTPENAHEGAPMKDIMKYIIRRA